MGIVHLESETHLNESRKKVFAFISLLIIILSIYSNTFNASWHFDDKPNITDNPALHLTEFTWKNLKKTFYANQLDPDQVFRPAACLSFALNYYVGGKDTFGYHLVNVAIHFLAAIFLFLFVYHTLNLPRMKARYGPNSYSIALLSALLWAINPIQTQAITYIVQRMASMAGMFYILSMYLYLKGRIATRGSRKWLLFSLCGMSALLAFGSKQNAIMIPLSLYLYDLLLIQGITRENLKKNLMIFSLIALGIAAGGTIYYFSFTDARFSSFFSLYEIRPFTPWERLLTQFRVIVFYISLIIYPMSTRLSLAHDIAISRSLLDPPTTVLSLMLLIGIVMGSIYLARREPLISFSALFFLLNHVIESSIFPLELIFEHRNYIPSMLFFVPIAIGLLWAIRHFSHKKSMQVIITLSITLVIIGEGHATFMRNFTWKTEESLWIDSADKYPNLHRPQHNLSKYYNDRNETDRAIAGYERALGLKAINRKDEKAITSFNLGVIYFRKDEFEKAKTYYLQAIDVDPCLPGVHNNLAVILAATTKNFYEVHKELNKATACNSKSMEPHSNMGILLVKWGRVDEGIAELKKAMEIDPQNIPTLERLGYAYIKKGLPGAASICFKKILTQNKKNLRAFLYLAQIYSFSGNHEKARQTLEHFLDIMHDQDLIPFLEGLIKEKSLLQTSPDMPLILPVLAEAYQQKEALFEKNLHFLLDTLEGKR